MAPARKSYRHVPTPKTRAIVESNAGFGIAHEHIAEGIGIGRSALERHYAKELAQGTPKLINRVAEALFKKATGRKMDNAAVIAGIFLLKSRGKWKDNHQIIEHANADGSPMGGTNIGNVQVFLPDNGRDPGLLNTPVPMKLIEGRLEKSEPEKVAK